MDSESAPQDQLAILFLHKDEADSELPGDFLTNHQSPHRRRDYGGWGKGTQLLGESLAEAFHGGHVLEGESALEILPAVQAAAQDEVAFEQGATVAEDLEDFGTGHAPEHGMTAPGKSRTIGVSPFLNPGSFSQSAMPKWVKTVVAVLLLPVCFGATRTLVQVLGNAGEDRVWVPLLAGVACWFAIYLLLPKPMWLYVVGHELTHAIWTWLFGGRVKRFRASAQGGHVVVTRTNFLIMLAPYFFPLYAAGVVLGFSVGNAIWGWTAYQVWFHLLLGATYAFHVTLTGHVLQTRQTDLTDQGYLFSGVVILLGNMGILLFGLPLLTAEVDWLTVTKWWVSGTLDVLRFCWQGVGAIAGMEN
jgi:hypothetical protein